MSQSKSSVQDSKGNLYAAFPTPKSFSENSSAFIPFL